MCDLDHAIDRLDTQGYNHAQGMPQQQQREQQMHEEQMRSNIEYQLIYTKAALPDWFKDNAYDFMTKAFLIMGDDDNDKQGRIRELVEDTVSTYCDWLVKQPCKQVADELEAMGLLHEEYL